MKKQQKPVSNPRTRKLILLHLLSLLAGGMTTQAQGSTEPAVKNITVKALGMEDNSIRYRIQLENKEGEKFSVSISDATGSRLFYDVYQDRRFDRTFRLEEGVQEGRLMITVRSLKDNATQIFAISTETRVFKDYVITRL